MINLGRLIRDYMKTRTRVGFRERTGHYASEALKCRRDQYWTLTGVPETNPPDSVGFLKMSVGDAIENELTGKILQGMHKQGIQVLGTQVAVGGLKPNWTGYLDALLEIQDERGQWSKLVLEHKVKSGIGANYFFDKLDVSEDHLAQLGLYLKDLSEKGATSEGFLLYTLLSDQHYGEHIQINCCYEKDHGVVRATEAIINGDLHKVIHQTLDINKVLERWRELDLCVANKTEPKPDYMYKYPVTPEYLDNVSDLQLRKAIAGDKILGDWQVLYSRYKDLALKTDGVTQTYTPEEIGLLRTEYLKRHPKSKI